MVKDFLTDSEGVIIIKNGDIAVGQSDEQNLEELVMAEKGDFKRTPLAGSGGRKLRNPRNETLEVFEGEVKAQLEQDVWISEEVSMDAFGQMRVIATKQ